jgi:hypothetical protein
MKYRRWARQFYSAPPAAEVALAGTAAP